MSVRNIYRKLLYYDIMNKYSDELKRISHRMMDEKEPYYKDSRKYLGSVMKGMDQENLISALLELNIHELKQCMAAGVPGDAMTIANKRLKDLKAGIKAYIDEKGSAASIKVEVDNTLKEADDELERVRTSKTG